MKIEIVEFYPQFVDSDKHILIGTLHIYIIDWGVDLRGIHVNRERKQWRFRWPTKWAMEGGKKVAFPVFSLTDIEKNKEMLKIITQMGKEYIMKNFEDLL